MVKIIQSITYWPFRIIFSLFIKTEINGIDNLANTKSPVILALNHHSRFDAFILYLLPFKVSYAIAPIYFPTTLEYYRYPYKLIIGPIGAHAVPKRAFTIKQYLEKSFEVLSNKGSVLFFPHGGIPHKNKVKRTKIKPGVIYLSNETGVCIIPIKINNTDNIRKNMKSFKRTEIEINIKEKICFKKKELTKKELEYRSKIILNAIS